MFGVDLGDNIQWIEVFWTFIAVSGAVLAIINISFAHRACKSLKRLGITNGRMVLAKAARVTEGVRLTIQVIEIGLGVIAMTLPGQDVSLLPVRWQISALAIQWGIVACAILTMFQSVNSLRLRRYFLGEHSRKE